jgi:hypothetical protein
VTALYQFSTILVSAAAATLTYSDDSIHHTLRSDVTEGAFLHAPCTPSARTVLLGWEWWGLRQPLHLTETRGVDSVAGIVDIWLFAVTPGWVRGSYRKGEKRDAA